MCISNSWHRLSILAVAFVVLVGFVNRVAGTDRPYPNFSVTSLNGRFLLEAKSPQNDPKTGTGRIFQDDFTVSLFDGSSKKPTWQWKQGKNYASPKAAYVDDTGWCLLIVASTRLLIFSPAGKLTWELDVLGDAVPKEEVDRFVLQSSIGPLWRAGTYTYFLSDKDARLCCMRLHWGRRVVIDLAHSKLHVVNAELEKTLASLEKEYVLQTLDLAVKRLKEVGLRNVKSDPAIWNARLAAELAGQNKIREAVPNLFALEVVAFGSASQASLQPREEGKVRTDRCDSVSFRPTIQQALRRLGERPKCYPTTIFPRFFSDPKKQELEARELMTGCLEPTSAPPPRAPRVDGIRFGNTPEEILAQLGAPDSGGEKWTYQIDDDVPYTLQISWRNRQMTKLERITPPIWELPTERLKLDRQLRPLLHPVPPNDAPPKKVLDRSELSIPKK